MKNPLVLCFICFFCPSWCQNNLSLSSSNGKPFRLIIKSRAFNEIPQAHIFMENIVEDTLQVEIEFENKKKFPATIYFLEKGVPCRNKELNYRVESDGITLSLRFSGSNAIIPLPDPLVPDKPVRVERSDNQEKKSEPCTSAASQMLVERLAEKLGACSNDPERFDALKKGYASLCYSVQQVTYILSRFIHDREKLEAAKLLYSQCAEKDKFVQAGEAFQDARSIKELNDFIRAQSQ